MVERSLFTSNLERIEFFLPSIRDAFEAQIVFLFARKVQSAFTEIGCNGLILFNT